MKETNIKIISSILETFYHTTKLPIICVSTKGLITCHCGYTEDMLTTFKNYLMKEREILNKVLSNKDTMELLTINSNAEVVRKCIQADNLSINHIFYMGPFKSTLNFIDSKENILSTYYRPQVCINYLVELLKAIINDNIASTIAKGNINYISLNVRKAIKYIHDRYEEDLTIDLISNELNINKCYFCNIFKKETGLTFSNFINKFRVEKSKELLVNSSFSILDVAMSVGFNNQNYFAMAFKKELGMTPLQYRKEYSKA